MPSRTEIEGAHIMNSPIRRQKRDVTLTLVGNIADNFPITTQFPPVIVLGASAARDILMPANDIANDGLRFLFISNSSTTTGVLTLKTSADQALSPAVTIVQSASQEMVYVHGVGWKKA